MTDSPPMADEGRAPSSSVRRVWCADCPPGDTSAEAAQAAIDGFLDVTVDWWGAGVERTFPAPEPLKSHGARWVDRRTLAVVHACGTFAPAARD